MTKTMIKYYGENIKELCLLLYDEEYFDEYVQWEEKQEVTHDEVKQKLIREVEEFAKALKGNDYYESKIKKIDDMWKRSINIDPGFAETTSCNDTKEFDFDSAIEQGIKFDDAINQKSDKVVIDSDDQEY